MVDIMAACSLFYLFICLYVHIVRPSICSAASLNALIHGSTPSGVNELKVRNAFIFISYIKLCKLGWECVVETFFDRKEIFSNMHLLSGCYIFFPSSSTPHTALLINSYLHPPYPQVTHHSTCHHHNSFYQLLLPHPPYPQAPLPHSVRW